MLMEHLVMVKVRHAEMEGDYLEAKRQLARTREKNMQVCGAVRWWRGGCWAAGGGLAAAASCSCDGVCAWQSIRRMPLLYLPHPPPTRTAPPSSLPMWLAAAGPQAG